MPHRGLRLLVSKSWCMVICLMKMRGRCRRPCWSFGKPMPAGGIVTKKDGYLAPLDPNFGGCGRTLTDEQGYFSLHTVRPGPYPWPNGGNDWRPAHIHFSCFGQGWAQRLITQMYFEGDPHIPLCPIVQTIADPKVIDGLKARLDMAHTVPVAFRAFRFGVVLRSRRSILFENKL